MDWWLISAVVGALSSAWLTPDWPLWPGFLLTAMYLIVGYIFPAFRLCPGFRCSTMIFTGLLCGIMWGMFNARMALHWTMPQADYREARNVKVKIVQIVQKNDIRWRIDAQLLDGPDEWQLPSVHVLRPQVRLNWYQPEGAVPQLGEVWQMTVRLRPATGLLNQGGFNYQAYLLRQRVRATGSVLEAKLSAPAPYLQVRQYLYNEYLNIRDSLEHSGVLLALVLGERHWLDSDDWRLLQRTGVAHLMAISGLHLSMVFATSWWLARFLLSFHPVSRTKAANLSYQSLLIAWITALSYAALAGFAVATLRALLLITMAVGYRLLARHITTQRLLLRVLALVLVFDPLAWLDTGFWLSFAAVFAIFVWIWRLPPTSIKNPSGSPVVNRWRQAALQLWRLEVMLTLLLWPLSALFFQGVSVIAPVANMLVMPLFSIIILPVALFATLLMLFRLPGPEYVLSIADTALKWLWEGLTFIAQFNWGWVNTSHWLVTILLFSALLSFYWPGRWSTRSLMAIGFCSAMLLWCIQLRSDEALWLHILDVGQGSAAVVQRGSSAMVVDAGPRYPGGFDLGAAVVVPFLNNRGLQPDYLILSHSHLDHTGGAEAVQQAFPSVITLDTQGKFQLCKWGQAWHWQGVQVHALAPLPGPSFGPNNDSCVLQLHYQGQRILLPGDIERIAEFRLLRRYDELLRSQIFLIPHHGSRTSSGEPILAVIQPEIALISRGYLNRFGMPHTETLERLDSVGASVYDTGLAGQISLQWTGERWLVKTYRADIGNYWFNQLQPDNR